jgi:hypothetical protein
MSWDSPAWSTCWRTRAPACAWPTEVSVATANVGLPDSNAVYCIKPFVVQPHRRMVLSGRYLDVRRTTPADHCLEADI